jgi:predicted nucleotidyltransferase
MSGEKTQWHLSSRNSRSGVGRFGIKSLSGSKQARSIQVEEGLKLSNNISDLMEQYVHEIQKIYGCHLRKIILYGSYARGDYGEDSDIDIMILLDISDLEIKDYFKQLVDMTFDFNMDYNTDIKPIAKNEEHFQKWVTNYPFYANINKEGVILYGAA